MAPRPISQVPAKKGRRGLQGDMKKITVLVERVPYESIVEFFGRSSSGISGAEAIRRIIREFGKHCHTKLNEGIPASNTDLKIAEELSIRPFTQGFTNE